MSKQTSIFDGEDSAWVRDYLKPRYPDLIKSYLEASRIFRSSRRRGAVTAKGLDTPVAHARSSRTPLGENSASMLGELTKSTKPWRQAFANWRRGAGFTRESMLWWRLTPVPQIPFTSSYFPRLLPIGVLVYERWRRTKCSSADCST